MYETYTEEQIAQMVKDQMKIFKNDYPFWDVVKHNHKIRIPYGTANDWELPTVEIEVRVKGKKGSHREGEDKTMGISISL